MNDKSSIDTAALRPRLVLRIGVTGHRPDEERLSETELPALKETIKRILATVKGALERVQRAPEHKGIFSAEPPLMRLVSPLAEGADRAAALAASDIGIELNCPLPYPRGEYEKDFKTPQSLSEFRELLAVATSVYELPGARQDASSAYRSVGLMTLRHADLLIAVWDGKEGPLGGTADMVERAITLDIPVIWLEPKTGTRWRLIQRRDNAHVTPGTLLHMARDADENALEQLVADLTRPPAAANGARLPNKEDEARACLEGFLRREREQRRNLWLAYPILLNLLGVRALKTSDIVVRPYLRETHDEWAAIFAVLEPLGLRTREPLTRIILPRYAFADKLGLRLGQVYRSSYVLSYFLSALAVFIALAGLPFHEWSKAVLLTLEVFVLAGILIMAKIGEVNRWHQRWLDYRHIAERLRHAAALYLFGTPGLGESVRFGADQDVGTQWIGWYMRATMRELPLPHAAVDARYVEAAKEAVRLIDIDGQITYHRQNALRQSTISHRLEHIGHFFLYVTIFVCGLAAFGDVLGIIHIEEWKPALIFIGGLLPAIGASIFAIRFQGDFRSAADRSLIAWQRLTEWKREMDRPDADFFEVASITQAIADLMAAELADWRFVYQAKPSPVM